MRNFRATPFFRASARCSKILNGKKHIFNTGNSGHTLFFRASASCSKILNDKNISIHLKFSGQLCFSGQTQVAQNSWMQKVYSIQWKFSGQILLFSASAKFSKILNGKKNIFASVKAITVKFLVWENTTRKEFHPLELTRKVTTEFAYKGTSRGLHKERCCRIDVINELICNCKRCHSDRTNVTL